MSIFALPHRAALATGFGVTATHTPNPSRALPSQEGISLVERARVEQDVQRTYEGLVSAFENPPRPGDAITVAAVDLHIVASSDGMTADWYTITAREIGS